MQSLSLAWKGSGRHSRAAISLQPETRGQAEPSKSSEITGGGKVCLKPMQRPELETFPKEGRGSEGDLCWVVCGWENCCVGKTPTLAEGVHGRLAAVGGVPSCHEGEL